MGLKEYFKNNPPKIVDNCMILGEGKWILKDNVLMLNQHNEVFKNFENYYFCSKDKKTWYLRDFNSIPSYKYVLPFSDYHRFNSEFFSFNDIVEAKGNSFRNLEVKDSKDTW